MFGSRRRILIAAGIVAGALGVATPAAHAATGSTSVTFTIASGALNISVPTSAASFALTDTGGNYTGSGTFGTTTVTDTRGGVSSSVTVTASSTGFTGTTNAKVLPASDGSLSTGTVTFVPGMVAAGTVPVGTNLATTGGQQILLGTTVGSGSATYTPTLTITVPQGSAVADTYTGSVVQTAA